MTLTENLSRWASGLDLDDVPDRVVRFASSQVNCHWHDRINGRLASSGRSTASCSAGENLLNHSLNRRNHACYR